MRVDTAIGTADDVSRDGGDRIMALGSRCTVSGKSMGR